ncbi:MAG: alpha/beta family hydrolase [Desulfopila sp.]|jgi:pimeloyl-ACP methyl ester carboxylesterase|nr:alpha/beta family hydrolase [Desulfopila sp.]
MMLFLQLLYLALIFYGAVFLVVFVAQKRFIFYPTRTRHILQESSAVSRLSLTSDGQTLQGWLLRPALANKKVIIYFGGNSEDIFNAADQFENFSDTAVALVNYRGYGTSSGTPGEKEFFRDALAVYDHIAVLYAPEKLFLMGRSLGASVACHVAASRRATGLILVSPFDTMESQIQRKFPLLPVGLLLRHKFNSLDSVPKISIPVLILYGGNDNVVPPTQTENLIRLMTGPKQLVYIAEAEHNTIEHFAEYELMILQFIALSEENEFHYSLEEPL